MLQPQPDVLQIWLPESARLTWLRREWAITLRYSDPVPEGYPPTSIVLQRRRLFAFIEA
jgi:hypothetical protein